MLSDVNSSLSGFVRANHGLRFVQNRNCIVRRKEDLSGAKVKLISGGGSGHEPAHNGYVGRGMLDAAVCGDVFCSPSATSIVDCLRTVAGVEESVLFIVNNYTGDRLNFGLAVERARSQYGYRRLRILLNDEDCSIDETLVKKSVGKRGLAGCVVVIKLLGAMAELGHSMDELYQFGDGLLRGAFIATFGFTFDVVDQKLHNIELGKGLHGEPGVYRMDVCEDFEPIIQFALDKISKKVCYNAEVVIFVNNLGGTSEFMMGIFLDTLCRILEGKYKVKRIYTGGFFTSLSQCGLSITLMNLAYSDQLIKYLDYEVQVASPLFGKAPLSASAPSEIINFEDVHDPKAESSLTQYKLKFHPSTQSRIANILKEIANSLLSVRDTLNAYDRECGDGDTGNTIANAANALLTSLDSKIDLQHPARLLQDISVIMQLNVGGTSGAIYSLFFQAASHAILEADNDPAVCINHWLKALSNGNAAIMRYALTEVGDRTMLDPLKQGEDELRSSMQQNLPMVECVGSFVRGCAEVAEATRSMRPKSGRASYSAVETGQVDYQYPDPGAYAVAVWSKALFDGCEKYLQ